VATCVSQKEEPLLSERTRDGAPPLTLGLEPDRERVIVRPAGEIDIATIDALQDEVA
jgi:hypothetical protein